MIQFQSPDFYFSMKVLGYQYPDTTPLRFNWDANWLSVKITVRKEGKQFTFTDPCLQTRELSSLKSFFEDMLTEKSPKKDEISFIEPVLFFTYDKLEEKRTILSITVGVFYKIQGWPFTGKELEGLDLTFEIFDDDVRKVIQQINQWMTAFPDRNIEQKPEEK